jgi:hypothetical protein
MVERDGTFRPVLHRDGAVVEAAGDSIEEARDQLARVLEARFGPSQGDPIRHRRQLAGRNVRLRR